jgi:hypothetical protein
VIDGENSYDTETHFSEWKICRTINFQNKLVSESQDMLHVIQHSTAFRAKMNIFQIENCDGWTEIQVNIDSIHNVEHCADG